MEYLLKSSAILSLFFICYQLFLQRETFFIGNRWFLLSGLILSALVPLIVIPIYVESTPVVLQDVPITNQNVSNSAIVYASQIETSFDFLKLISTIYIIGVIFFLGKLLIEFISLSNLLKKHQYNRDKWFYYIETEMDIAPFSFFKCIVYNPNQFNENELQLILNHERVHARQFHSLDILLSQLACALFWFNPLVWLYKKALQQNLEFIADHEAQTNASCEKSYQKLLLKTSIQSHQLALTNNFYNSIIKKRIVMLHKSKSNKMNAYKYALVIPLLLLFVLNFNTETIAQTKKITTEKTKIGQNILKYVITKDTKDKQLESIKEKMAEQEVTIEYKNIARNFNKEITAIRIKYDSKKGSGEFFVNSNDPIKDIAITLNVDENTLTVGQAMKNLSQSFEIITKDDGGKKVKTSGSGSNVFVYSTDDDDVEVEKEVIVIGKDGEEHEVKKEKKVYVIKSGSTKNSNENEDILFVKKNKRDTIWVKQDVKNIVWTDDDGGDVEIIAVENGKNNVRIFTNGDEQPLIFLDGKEVTKKEIENLEPDNIENVNVLKGDKAIEKHGKKAKDGVIEITTKKQE